ncbi:uncharacterized protein LOC136038714 [Artemia franciscana]
MCCLLPCSCCPLRITLLAGGAYAMFQAITGISIASIAIAMYHCETFPDPDDFLFGWAYIYFFGESTKEACVRNGEVWAAIKPPSQGYGNYPTIPEKTNEYFIGYLTLNIIWAIASGIFLLGVLCKRKALYSIWVIVTTFVCVYDLSMAGLYMADVAVAGAKNFGTAIVLPALFSRFLIGWVANVIFVLYAFCAARWFCCKKKDNKFDNEEEKAELC